MILKELFKKLGKESFWNVPQLTRLASQGKADQQDGWAALTELPEPEKSLHFWIGAMEIF